MARTRQGLAQARFEIVEDETAGSTTEEAAGHASSTDIDEAIEELEPGGSDSSDSDASDESDVSPGVMDDISRFEESFKGITKKYKILDRIGEGMTPHLSQLWPLTL